MLHMLLAPGVAAYACLPLPSCRHPFSTVYTVCTGGAREVHKRKGEGYKLFWPETPDFVRLASKCDAIIVPFAAVGADDAYDVSLLFQFQLCVGACDAIAHRLRVCSAASPFCCTAHW